MEWNTSYDTKPYYVPPKRPSGPIDTARHDDMNDPGEPSWAVILAGLLCLLLLLLLLVLYVIMAVML